MVEVTRISYDRGHTELIYYVTFDDALVTTSRLVELSQYVTLQEAVLIFSELVDEGHLVEGFGQSRGDIKGKGQSMFWI